jgi:hypothetical protein
LLKGVLNAITLTLTLNNSPQVYMFYSDTLSCFLDNQSVFLVLNSACLVEIQNIPILLFLRNCRQNSVIHSRDKPWTVTTLINNCHTFISKEKSCKFLKGDWRLVSVSFIHACKAVYSILL